MSRGGSIDGFHDSGCAVRTAFSNGPAWTTPDSRMSFMQNRPPSPLPSIASGTHVSHHFWKRSTALVTYTAHLFSRILTMSSSRLLPVKPEARLSLMPKRPSVSAMSSRRLAKVARSLRCAMHSSLVGRALDLAVVSVLVRLRARTDARRSSSGSWSTRYSGGGLSALTGWTISSAFLIGVLSTDLSPKIPMMACCPVRSRFHKVDSEGPCGG